MAAIPNKPFFFFFFNTGKAQIFSCFYKKICIKGQKFGKLSLNRLGTYTQISKTSQNLYKLSTKRRPAKDLNNENIKPTKVI